MQLLDIDDVENSARLDEFDKDEWREVCRIVCPHVSDEEFDDAWEEFQELKMKRQLH